jgi:hypothetical protein
MKSTESDLSPDEPLRAAPPSPQRRESKAIRVGLTISVVLHLVGVALYPVVMSILVPVPVPVDPGEVDRIRAGMEVMLLQEVADAPDPEPRLEPLETTVATPVAAVTPPPAVDEELPPRPEARLSVAERLRPRVLDPRLWIPMDPDITQLTDQERAELLLRGMIQSWNDSMAVAAALADDALDWTYTDDEGRRWGLSPGRLHLGDFSIPLPFQFLPPPGRREEWAQRQWEIQDMARAAAAASIRETWAERAREIRRRMEEERANPPGDGSR